MDAVLVIDLGTTSVRSAVVSDQGKITHEANRDLDTHCPEPGIVENDADAVVSQARDAIAETVAAARAAGISIGSAAIANQRASTVVWDASTGSAVGPVLGWQDLRTVGACIELNDRGVSITPNESATKIAWLADAAAARGIPIERLRCGTLDSWLTWALTGGEVHVTDPTNAWFTGLVDFAGTAWDAALATRIGVEPAMLPEIVPSTSPAGWIRVGDDDVPIVVRIGDQQASLIGQGGIEPGVFKTTFGTAAITDVATGVSRPDRASLAAYPIIALETTESTSYGFEAAVSTAGESVRSLVDYRIAESPAHASRLASETESSGGAQFVPAWLGLGLGSPHFDYGARSSFVGLSMSTGAGELARAVFEGIASRVAECVSEVERYAGIEAGELRADGSGAGSDVLMQAQADRLGIPVARSSQRKASALGAGLLAHLCEGSLSPPDLARIPSADRIFDPVWSDDERCEHAKRWSAAIKTARSWT